MSKKQNGQPPSIGGIVREYNKLKSENEELRYHLNKVCKLTFGLLVILHDKKIKLPEAKSLRQAVEDVGSNVVL